jgi:hypothetical protein
MVTWEGNREPQVTIVTDGVEREEWLGSTLRTLAVRSCDICTDNRTGRATGSQGAGGSAVGISGQWAATFTCAYGSGRYNYTFSQDRNGNVTGSAQGRGILAFQRGNLSGQVRNGTFTANETNNQGNVIRFAGNVNGNFTSISGTYTQTQQSGTCNFQMVRR